VDEPGLEGNITARFDAMSAALRAHSGQVAESGVIVKRG
jgi:hypothetical protein